jgi:parallel beta-helix repeat protein
MSIRKSLLCLFLTFLLSTSVGAQFATVEASEAMEDFGLLQSDVNRDGNVNILDVSMVASALGSHPGDPRWNSTFDLNHDNEINILDVVLVVKNYGKSWIVYDFNETSDLSVWNPINGGWNVVNGSLEGFSNGEGLIYTVDKTWEECTLTAKVKISADSEKPEAALCFNIVDSGNFYCAGLGCWGHRVSISRVVNNVPEELISNASSTSVVKDVWHTLSIKFSGNTIMLYVNDALELTINDSTFSSGFVGMRTWSSHILVDNVTVSGFAETSRSIYPSINTYIVATLTELTDVVSRVVPGDIVLIRGGIYQPTSPINFRTSGTSANPITYEAYPGEKVVFDGSLATRESLGGDWQPPLIVIYDTVSFNILRNIEERNSPGRGILIAGNDNVLDRVETHHNNGVGIHVDGRRNKVLYSISHDNIDTGWDVYPWYRPPGQDADGMGTGPEGADNLFFGCVAYGNSDDGIDTLGSTGNTIENCVAYDNGRLQGDGCGFKMGDANERVIKCVAFNNNLEGFEIDDSPNSIIDHCTAYNNGIATASKPATGKDGYCTRGANNILTNNIGSVWWDIAPTMQNSNTWNLGITNYGFLSIDPASSDFLSLRANSPCRGKASDGSDLGALQYGERISNLLGT